MSDIRISVLITDDERVRDAEIICRQLRAIAPYCRIHVTTVNPLNDFDGDGAYRRIEAARWSDVVLYLTGEDRMRANAGLIALRERAGFTHRYTEHEYARAWFSPNRKRSLYVLDALPGAWRVLALALEVGCGDPLAAERLRGGGDKPALIAV